MRVIQTLSYGKNIAWNVLERLVRGSNLVLNEMLTLGNSVATVIDEMV